MAGKADFTEAEWDTLQKGVTGAAFLVSIADTSFFDTFKEAGALAGHLTDARANSSSELVRALAQTRGTGFGLTTSREEVEAGTLEALRAAMVILRSKAADETAAYTDFVLAVANSVANAASNVSTSESGALDKIKAALDPPR